MITARLPQAVFSGRRCNTPRGNGCYVCYLVASRVLSICVALLLCWSYVVRFGVRHLEFKLRAPC